jgi:small subunit ribosomal protein S4e
MKNHLKRISAPKSWAIDRKKTTFTTRPKPSGHLIENGMPIGMIIRDILGLASTMREVKKALNAGSVLVDGFARKDHRFHVGLFDIITFPKLKKSFQVLFDTKGRIIATEHSQDSEKICKVTGKIVLLKGKMQYNLHDGKNIISEKKARVGDSVVLSIPKLEIKEVLELKPGVEVYLVKGKHQGSSGKLKELQEKNAIYSCDGKDIETAKSYLFVIKELNKSSLKKVSKDKKPEDKKSEDKKSSESKE